MIITKKHRFKNPPRNRRRTNRIIFHHSVSGDVSSEEIHRWHLDRGWLGIGYAVIIRYNGDIELGRGLEKVGAHAGAGANYDSIGVCVVGDFTKHKPTDAQIKSVIEFNKYCFDKYGELLIEGHSDHMSTQCPGHLFPLDYIRKKSLKEDKDMGSELNWEQEQAIRKIKSLHKKGYINSPAVHIEKIKRNEPIGDYVWLSLINRILQRGSF